jgi:hypothetical protein
MKFKKERKQQILVKMQGKVAHIVGRNIKYYNYYENQYGVSSQTKNRPTL